jgi:hypothetical protein
VSSCPAAHSIDLLAGNVSQLLRQAQAIAVHRLNCQSVSSVDEAFFREKHGSVSHISIADVGAQRVVSAVDRRLATVHIQYSGPLALFEGAATGMALR